jgi:O-methyltransferase
MLRYAVDELNSDRVLGWAFDPDASPDVMILVDGEPVGRANLGSFRIDVAQSLGDDRAAQCGFEFRFQPDHFRRVSGRQARIAVRVGNEELAPVVIPLVLQPSLTAPSPGPFPPEVLALLARYNSRYGEAHRWDDELTNGAVEDLRFLLERGPRAVPELHRYLALIAQLWIRAAFVERYFPRENDMASVDDKDRSGVQNSALEVFAIAAHLVTLHAHHVDGPFLEFGCFKGFSTAILSDACHQLGITMHVFDSFSGLPPSDSSYYHEGEFAGSLPEVRRNVFAYGRPQPVVFHEGFFSDTLRGFTEPRLMCVWMDVDLESSSADVMAVLPRLDPRGVLFSHECPPELFANGEIRAERAPEQVVPPILDAFDAAGRAVAGRHVAGHTGAFWDADSGIAPLPTPALLALRDLALSV